MSALPLTDEQRDLVERNVGLAYRFANDYCKCYPARDRDEVLSAAFEGLTIAAGKYDPARASFSIYARWWMRARVRHAVIRSYVVHIPAHAFNAGSRFAGLKDRATRPSEVPEHIACRPDGRDGLGEVLELAAGLPARWRYVVEQIYIQGRKYADVGQELGVSKQRAQQIAGEAIGRLKLLLGVAAIAE